MPENGGDTLGVLWPVNLDTVASLHCGHLFVTLETADSAMDTVAICLDIVANPLYIVVQATWDIVAQAIWDIVARLLDIVISHLNFVFYNMNNGASILDIDAIQLYIVASHLDIVTSH